MKLDDDAGYQRDEGTGERDPGEHVLVWLGVVPRHEAAIIRSLCRSAQQCSSFSAKVSQQIAGKDMSEVGRYKATRSPGSWSDQEEPTDVDRYAFDAHVGRSIEALPGHSDASLSDSKGKEHEDARTESESFNEANAHHQSLDERPIPLLGPAHAAPLVPAPGPVATLPAPAGPMPPAGAPPAALPGPVAPGGHAMPLVNDPFDRVQDRICTTLGVVAACGTIIIGTLSGIAGAPKGDLVIATIFLALTACLFLGLGLHKIFARIQAGPTAGAPEAPSNR